MGLNVSVCVIFVTCYDCKIHKNGNPGWNIIKYYETN